MKLLNSIVKWIRYFGLHLLLVIEMYLTSIAIVSPFYCILCAISQIAAGKMAFFWQIWLLSAVPLWIVLVIYVEVKVHKK